MEFNSDAVEVDVDVQGVAKETKRVSDSTFVVLLEPVRRSLLVVGLAQVRTLTLRSSCGKCYIHNKRRIVSAYFLDHSGLCWSSLF